MKKKHFLCFFQLLLVLSTSLFGYDTESTGVRADYTIGEYPFQEMIEKGIKGRLRGKRGHTGHKGKSGRGGRTGSRGSRGQGGSRGSRGHRGSTGHQGPTGHRGSTGNKGHRGHRGKRGRRGKKGDKEPCIYGSIDIPIVQGFPGTVTENGVGEGFTYTVTVTKSIVLTLAILEVDLKITITDPEIDDLPCFHSSVFVDLGDEETQHEMYVVGPMINSEGRTGKMIPVSLRVFFAIEEQFSFLTTPIRLDFTACNCEPVTECPAKKNYK